MSFEPTAIIQAASIYDQVKGEFFAQYVATKKLYEDCLKRRGEERDERREHLFKSSVVALALDMRPKIAYTDKPEKYAALTTLDSSSFLSKSFEDMEKYYFLERDLIEDNGITKYEYEKITASSYTLRRAAQK